MYAFPQMSFVSLVGYGGGGIDWPGLGAVIVHALLTAVIGSALVLLRASAGRGQHGGPQPGAVAQVCNATR